MAFLYASFGQRAMLGQTDDTTCFLRLSMLADIGCSVLLAV